MLYHCEELNVKIVSVNHVRNYAGKFFIKERPFHALAFRFSGTARFQAAGKNISSYPSDVFYIAAGEEYEVEYTDGETIAVHFIADGYDGRVENYAFKDPARISAAFSALLKAWGENEGQFALKSRFFALLSELVELEKGKKGGFYDAVRMLSEEYTDAETTLSSVCDACGISVSNFRLRFKSEYGCSPKRYLLKLRLEHALRLLTDPTGTVENAALLSGFADSKYFARLVKTTYGVPPSEIRKRLL